MATTRIARSVARTATLSTRRAATRIGRMIWNRLPWPAKILAPLTVLGASLQSFDFLGSLLG